MADAPELAQLRATMDELNGRICAALHERARLCRRIGALKRARGLKPVDPERERLMLAAALEALPPDGFDQQQLAAVLRAIFAASREVVERPDT